MSWQSSLSCLMTHMTVGILVPYLEMEAYTIVIISTCSTLVTSFSQGAKESVTIQSNRTFRPISCSQIWAKVCQLDDEKRAALSLLLLNLLGARYQALLIDINSTSDKNWKKFAMFKRKNLMFSSLCTLKKGFHTNYYASILWFVLEFEQ